MKLAIDFDGVIHDPNSAPPGGKMGKPLPGAVEALRQLSDSGYGIVIHTVRADTAAGAESVRRWLEYFNIAPYSVTAIKPNADVYIDDKAYRFTGWPEALKWLS